MVFIYSMCEQRIVDVFSVERTILRCGDKITEAMDTHAMTAIVDKRNWNPTQRAPTNRSFGHEINWLVLDAKSSCVISTFM